MRRSIALILGTGLGLALMFFSGSRFIDLVERALPPSQQLMGFFGLAGFEGGLVVWILIFRYGSRGHWQRAISALMVILCLAGIGYATYTDLKLSAGANGVILNPDKDAVDLAITAIAIIIIANIAATVGIHLTDPEALHAAAEEEAKSNITAETLKHINANSHSLAAELAPSLAARWMHDMRAQYLGMSAAPRYSAHIVEQPMRELPTAEPTRTVAPYANEAPIITPPPARRVPVERFDSSVPSPESGTQTETEAEWHAKINNPNYRITDQELHNRRNSKNLPQEGINLPKA